MRTSITEFTKKAKLVKKSDKYEVYDLTLESLVLSMTILHQDKSTTGHSHDDTEEIYLFIGGKGKIELGNKTQDIVTGYIIIVPAGVFHRVYNIGDFDLTFICLFKKYAGRGE
jgi:mannose-6-phosphate isomerase-like protein (cupin superfamily)